MKKHKAQFGFTSLLILVSPLLLLTDCSDSNNVNSTEIIEIDTQSNVDENILWLRNINEFPVTYVSVDDVGLENDIFFGDKVSKPLDGTKTTNSILLNNSTYYEYNGSSIYQTPVLVEQFVELAPDYIATGIGGRCTSSTFSVARIRGYRYTTQGVNFSDMDEQDSRAFQYAVEAYAKLNPSDERVVIGIGLWVGRGDVRALSIYTAPFDAINNKVELYSGDIDNNEAYVAVTIVVDGPAKANATIGSEERRLRTFDIFNSIQTAEKKVITGYGAGVHNDNCNRIGLEITTLP